MALDRLVDSTQLDNNLTSIANAIRTKGGTNANLAFPSDFITAINNISTGGGGTVSPKDVNFYDYDGTLLYSYTALEFAALSSMPANPSHSGLTAQGWNWTLTDAKTYVTSYGILDIGQIYITDDGKTRLYIRIAAPGRMTVPLRFSQTVANGVTINWGDGSATETVSGTGNRNTSHTYSSIGDYVIILSPLSGCVLGLGNGTASYCVLGLTGNAGRVYFNMLKKVEIGSKVTSIDDYAFRYCYSLASVTIPSSVTSIGQYAFGECYSLASIIIPPKVTSIGSYAFNYCYSLSNITIPSSVTSISDHAFYNCCSLASITIPSSVTSISTYMFGSCYSLASITIPSSVTTISAYAFSACYGMAAYHIKPTSPPTLSNINAFNNIPSNCIIYVPAASLDTYKSTSNWSNYASKMVGE